MNVASRMESTGAPGRLQCSAETASLLEGLFHLEARGLVAVKGRGELRTFWVGRR